MKNSRWTKILLAIFCALPLVFGVAACNDENEPQDDKNYADVFIFMGQSNMAGRGEAADAIPCEEAHGYEFRAVTGNDADGWLYPVVEPFGKAENNDALQDGTGGDGKKSGGVVSSFCEAYYQETGVPVIAVSASVGNTSITQWVPGSDYFTEALRRLNACLFYLDVYSDFIVRNINMVWCQGCNDATKSTNGELDYPATLKTIVEAMQTEGFIDTCFLIPLSEYDNNKESSTKVQLANIQIELCENDDDFVLASLKFRNVPPEMRDDPHFHQGIYNVTGWDAGKNVAKFIKTGVAAECEPYISGEAKELADKFGITLKYNEGGEAHEYFDVANGGYADALANPGKWYINSLDTEACATISQNTLSVKTDGTKAKTVTFFCQPALAVGTQYDVNIRIRRSGGWGNQTKALQFGTGTGYSAGDKSGKIETSFETALVGYDGEKTFTGTFTVEADAPFFFTLSTYANPFELEIVFTAK